MTKVTVKFRSDRNSGKTGLIHYQISHSRKFKQIPSGIRIYSDEWDPTTDDIIVSDMRGRLDMLTEVKRNVKRDIEAIRRIIRRFESADLPFTPYQIALAFKTESREHSLLNYMSTCVMRLRKIGKVRTAETYIATMRSICKFLERNGTRTHIPSAASQRCGVRSSSRDIMLDEIDSETIESFEAWQRGLGNTPNTSSFYLRILRAVYNRAVEAEIIPDRNPFKRVFTGVEPTRKRAIPLRDMRKLRWLDLSFNPTLEYARDIFLLSFMLRGMSLVDMAFLKKSDLQNGMLTYRRRKTGQVLHIAWTTEMQTLLNKYPENPTQYLLPLICKREINDYYAYRNIGSKINYNLRKVAALAGITMPLTLYVARHSWATAAKTKGIPLTIISEGMGHNSESTTRIYLASLETSIIDRANHLIIGSLE
ncbi:MAG: site-specific integrase [Bacteroides sp.]|nr:site-specific integrase [Bacteroides sp.]